MPLSTYDELRSSVLNWLARPGDPLVEPAVPDMIRLFEVEANRRLRVGGSEKYVTLTTAAQTGGISLPDDFMQIRRVSYNGMTLAYVPPSLLPGLGGPPLAYTLWGNATLWIGPLPDTVYDIELIYNSGVPPLSDGNPTNWLITQSPDAYLFGVLAEAELYIGHDERSPMWLQRREAAFASIEMADRKTRWGGPLQIRAHGITIAPGDAQGGSSISAGGTHAYVGTVPPTAVYDGDLWWDSSSSPGGGQLYVWFSGQWVVASNQPVGTSAGIVTLNPGNGETVQIEPQTPSVFIASPALDALTVRLPPTPTVGDTVQLCFAAPVAVLGVQNSVGTPVGGAPTSAYGPGAAVIFRYVAPGQWSYWK